MIWSVLSLCLALSLSPPKTFFLGNLRISLPPQTQAGQAYPLVLAFGGVAWATPEFLEQETPLALRQKAVFVYSPCLDKGGLGLEAVERAARFFMRQKGLEIKQISICGFSAGGPDAMTANPENYACIALIDPVPKPEHYVRFAPNYILSFRRLSWANSDFYGQHTGYRAFNELSKNIRKKGGKVEESDIQHKEYLSYFFNKFGDCFL